MSFSFVVRGASIAAAVAAATSKMDEVVEQQPSHAADRDAVVAAAEAYAKILREPEEGEAAMLNIHGSLTGQWEGSKLDPTTTTGASIGVQASIVREPLG